VNRTVFDSTSPSADTRTTAAAFEVIAKDNAAVPNNRILVIVKIVDV